MVGRVESYLLERIKKKGATHLTLIDPDKASPQAASQISVEAESAGTGGVMVGGSTATSTRQLDEVVRAIKKAVKIPVILFPSNITGLSQYADAIWFMSLLNSTNVYFLIGAQALSASVVKRYGIEPIPMGYIILGEGGAAGYIGQAHPVPYEHPEIAAMYASAAQFLGMRFVYLEAGSGAKEHVPPSLVSLVRKNVEIPIVVGGGVKSAEIAGKLVEAGANIIVTGTLVEEVSLLRKVIGEIVGAVEG